MPKPTYPSDHKPGMRVAKGGSMCKNCEYLAPDKKNCKQEDFIKWNGSSLIPAPIDEYCSDWWEAAPGVMKEGKRIEDVPFEEVGL